MPVWLGVLIYLFSCIVASVLIIAKDDNFDTGDSADIIFIGFLSLVWWGVLPIYIVGWIGRFIYETFIEKF